MFRRPHHQRIARILQALDADLFTEHHCWFGGGTAIALLHGEYRESVDIDFLVSDAAGYRALREIVRRDGLSGLTTSVVSTTREPRVDSYGIRTGVLVDNIPIKFEIVSEGRIDLEEPAADNAVCGVRALSGTDQVATKLLANDDRWADRSVFSRDLIDLAMMRPDQAVLTAGLQKAMGAYGTSVVESFEKATTFVRERPAYLADCRRALAIEAAPAQILHGIEQLTKKVARAST